MNFTLCESTGFFLRVALIGPAGSGKTWTALQIATALGYDKVGIIDTENRSARRYARSFGKRFQSLELQHYSPRDYIDAIRAAEQGGIEVLIIDSLSHAWAGKGGVLEMVDQSARRQARGANASSFNGWREVTPEHNRLVEALVQARLHLIVTMRTKTEYVIDKDEKGRAVPRKVGLQPVQRDGLEYEFDIVGDMSPEHNLALSKSRCPMLKDDAIIDRPGPELAHTLRAWLDGAGPVEPEDRRDPRPGSIDPPARTDGATDDLDGETGQETRGERHAAALRPADLDAIAPHLADLSEIGKYGDAEALGKFRARLNAEMPATKRTRAQGEALRKAIESAAAAIAARAQSCDPGPEQTTEAAAPAA